MMYQRILFVAAAIGFLSATQAMAASSKTFAVYMRCHLNQDQKDSIGRTDDSLDPITPDGNAVVSLWATGPQGVENLDAQLLPTTFTPDVTFFGAGILTAAEGEYRDYFVSVQCIQYRKSGIKELTPTELVRPASGVKMQDAYVRALEADESLAFDVTDEVSGQ